MIEPSVKDLIPKSIDSDFICTKCGEEFGNDPGRKVEWFLGRCKYCHKEKYLTSRGNFKNAKNS